MLGICHGLILFKEEFDNLKFEEIVKRVKKNIIFMSIFDFKMKNHLEK
jgi:hypothetical protein